MFKLHFLPIPVHSDVYFPENYISTAFGAMVFSFISLFFNQEIDFHSEKGNDCQET